jgi:hypothetical protein
MKFPLSIRLSLVVLVALNISFIFLAASESLEQSQTNTNESESNGYLAIEVSIHENISGMAAPLRINSSTCKFDSRTLRFDPSVVFDESKLISVYYIQKTSLAPVIKVIVWEDMSYPGMEHCSYGALHQIIEFPYSVHGFNITDLSNDAIAVNYHSLHFTLKPGESWNNETEEILAPECGKNTIITRKVMIKNYGRLEVVYPFH